MTITLIYLTCRSCGHRWLCGIWKPGDLYSAETVGTRCYCPECDAAPFHQQEHRVIEEQEWMNEKRT